MAEVPVLFVLRIPPFAAVALIVRVLSCPGALFRVTAATPVPPRRMACTVASPLRAVVAFTSSIFTAVGAAKFVSV